MDIRVSGHQVDTGDALREHVRLGRSLLAARADFVQLAGGKTYLSKAFDDPGGHSPGYLDSQELQGSNANTVYGVATVMEEVGLRSATTSVRAVNPNVALVFESDIAGDVPGIKPEESAVKIRSELLVCYMRRA
ncbi:MAG: hypothetical protein U5M50_06305 [Sphingobium sp.]|nr:hypothetical protein [Sphingobium sp.]